MNRFHRGPLATAPFRRLTLAWTFSNFGDSLLYLSLAIWTKDLTGSDAAAGAVLLFLGLPVLLAPLGGYLADRFPRRRLVTLANLVAAGGVLSLVLVEDASDIWLIYFVTFCYGFVSYVTSACGAGLVADMVPEQHLAGANGLLSTIDQGLRLLSPLVGAGMYGLIGASAIAATTSVMLVIAAVIVATIGFVESPPTPPDQRRSFWSEFAAGATHLRRTPVLGRLTLTLAAAVAITGFANSTVFAAVDQGLDRSSQFVGVLLSVQGGGSIAGGISVARLIARRGERVSLAIGLALMAAGIASFTTTSVVVMAVGAFVIGVSIPWAFVSYTTIRQRLTPLALQGRVSAAANVAFNGPQSAGTAVGAVLIASVDYRLLVVAMVVVVATCAVAIALAQDESAAARRDEIPASSAPAEPARPH